MLDHPKFLLFAILSFGMIHTLGFLTETGELADPSAPSGGIMGLADIMRGLMVFDYSWLDGNLIFLKFVLLVVQWVFIVLIVRDGLRFLRGV